MDSLVIGGQFFYASEYSENVFLKEISAYDMQAERISHFLLKNPEIVDPSNRNFVENLRLVEEHGISWDIGTISYTNGMQKLIQLCKPFRFIYTVGTMMKSLLENILHRVVYDLSELSIPSTITLMRYYVSSDYKITCPYHMSEITFLESENRYYPSCSHRNAFLFGLWMQLVGDKADLSTTEGRLVTFHNRMPSMDNRLVDAGFCMGVNCQTGREEFYCTHCGFIESDVEDMSFILWNHKVCSLLCHLKNYEITIDVCGQLDDVVL